MVLLCILVYFVSYLTRINYGAVILEIVQAEGILRSLASLALTGSFITYGVGQLIAGYLGDKIKPKYLVFIMSIVWLVVCTEIEKHAKIYDAPEEPKNQRVSSTTKLHITLQFVLMLSCIMFTIILQGILRDGVTTWMPSYISETYNISSYISILTGVILPVFSIICFQAALCLYNSKLNNELICAGSIFGIGFLATAVLAVAPSFSAALSVALSAVITGCMHGVNLILICMVPLHFKKYGKVSFTSGLLNSCTYIGSAISIYGIAKISENVGWYITILSWSAIALIGTIICFSCAKMWEEYFLHIRGC